MFWTEWQKGLVGQSLLLWEADDSSQGPASVSGPLPLCLLELKSRDFLAPPSDSDSKDRGLFASCSRASSTDRRGMFSTFLQEEEKRSRFTDIAWFSLSPFGR